MKKIILLIIPIALVFTACKKYEDGPAISLNSKKHRLVNSWVIDRAYESGVDQTSTFKDTYVNYNLTIIKNGTYTLSYIFNNVSPYDESGDWKFSNDKGEVYFYNAANNSNIGDKWTIYKLKEKELWMKYYNSSGSATELRFKEK